MDESDTTLDAGNDDAPRTGHHDAPGEAAGPPAAVAASSHPSPIARRSGVGNPLRVRL